MLNNRRQNQNKENKENYKEPEDAYQVTAFTDHDNSEVAPLNPKTDSVSNRLGKDARV